MNGIEIVNTIIITHQIIWAYLLAVGIGIILALIGLLIYDPTCIGLGFTTAFVSLLLFGFSAVGAKDEPTIQYQIVIDETVAAQDLLEKYEIIKIDGKIITVELKDDKIS